MENLPKIRIKRGETIGNELFFRLPDFSQNEKTYLEADTAAAAESLTANGTNFASGQHIIIGNHGDEKCEIVLTTSATATTIGCGALSFAHSRGTVVRFIPFNQITISSSADGITYAVLETVAIRPDSMETYYLHAAGTAATYYKYRFYNSTDATYSSYSDALIATDYADNTVHSIKHRALSSIGEEIGGKLTDEVLNEWLMEGRREFDQDPRVLRYSFRTKFNTDIGDCIPGRYSIAVPTDLRDPNTYKNILGLRIGKNNRNLDYVDWNTFMRSYRNSAHSTLTDAVTSASTTIVLGSSGDFDESGTVYIAAESIAGTNDEADYTANTETTFTLSGLTDITDSHDAGRDVWQNVTFGTPTAFTIVDGYIYFNCPFDDDLAGENIYLDYYSTMSAVNSDADTLDEPEYDMYVSWLKWKIKYFKSGGTAKQSEDSDYQEWSNRKTDLISKEMLGQGVYMIPDVDGYSGYPE